MSATAFAAATPEWLQPVRLGHLHPVRPSFQPIQALLREHLALNGAMTIYTGESR
jgi:hypothetical protein